MAQIIPSSLKLLVLLLDSFCWQHQLQKLTLFLIFFFLFKANYPSVSLNQHLLHHQFNPTEETNRFPCYNADRKSKSERKLWNNFNIKHLKLKLTSNICVNNFFTSSGLHKKDFLSEIVSNRWLTTGKINVIHITNNNNIS